MKIRIGVSTARGHPGADSLGRLADDMEELGFDSIWLPEILTQAAVDPIVASPPRPRFSFACTIASDRSSARCELSTCSVVIEPPEPKLRNSCSPAVTTSARCDFLERSASLIASSRRPSFSAPATFGANSRDCLRAAEK